MLHEFELGKRPWIQSKNICSEKGEGAIDHIVKKIIWVARTFNNQERSGKPKTVNSEAVLQFMEANQTSSASYNLVPLVTFVTSAKESVADKLCHM